MPFGKEVFKTVNRISNEVGRWERQARSVRDALQSPEGSKVLDQIDLATDLEELNLPNTADFSGTVDFNSPENSSVTLTPAIEELCHKFFLFHVSTKPLISIPLRVLNNSRLLKYLGRGSYGTAYSFTDDAVGQTVALKQIPLSPEGPRHEIEEVRKEVDLHSKLCHENIVQYIGFSEVPHDLYIVMEFMEGGSLRSQLDKIDLSAHIPNTQSVLPEELIMTYTKNIINGLIYLHTHRIIHRDLRAANVLISSTNVAKIADFGISKELSNLSTKSGFSTMAGNTYWKSPEMIQSKPELVGRRVDVWSLGITILEMIHCWPPFIKKYDQTQYMFALCIKTEVPEIPDFIGVGIRSILTKCLVFDMEQRSHSKDLPIWS